MNLEKKLIPAPEILSALGISSLRFDNSPAINSKSGTNGKKPAKEINTQNLWRSFKHNYPVEAMTRLISKCRVIIFSDWVSFDGGTEIWDGILSEVIRPLAGKNRKFIFQLGDTNNRKLFEINEIMDIISDYARYGIVSVVLDEQEAGNLFALLHGLHYPFTNQSIPARLTDIQYTFLFQIMHIDQLLICSISSILVFQKNKQFELKEKNIVTKKTAIDAAINLSITK
jgi:hypothetical protein